MVSPKGRGAAAGGHGDNSDKWRMTKDWMARETGLEPAASAVTGRRSNQLSYSRNPIVLGGSGKHPDGRLIREAPAQVKAGCAGLTKNQFVDSPPVSPEQ